MRLRVPESRRGRAAAMAALALAAGAPIAAVSMSSGSGAPDGARATASARPARAAADPVDAEIARARAKRQAVEPEAGVEGGFVEVPQPTSTPGRGSRASSTSRISPGAPTDAQVKEDVRALQREQAKVEAAIDASGAPLRAGSGRFIWPVSGPITSPFCERRSWESCHPGIDIGVGIGTPIRAADTGQVVLAGPQGGYGNFTCIRHTRSLTTCYAHQSAILVSVGQVVRQGQVIGRVGCTGLCFGPHLHFEVRVNGHVVNPMDYL